MRVANPRCLVLFVAVTLGVTATPAIGQGLWSNGDTNGATPVLFQEAVAAAVDPKRASKVMTATDAFGRPRVARGPRRRAAKTA